MDLSGSKESQIIRSISEFIRASCEVHIFEKLFIINIKKRKPILKKELFYKVK
jgi:hypothetical protein